MVTLSLRLTRAQGARCVKQTRPVAGSSRAARSGDPETRRDARARAALSPALCLVRGRGDGRSDGQGDSLPLENAMGPTSEGDIPAAFAAVTQP